MNMEERTALLADFMRDLAPQVTKYILAYNQPQDVQYAPEKIVNLTSQIASGLVTRFVELSSDSPPQTTPKEIAFTRQDKARPRYQGVAASFTAQTDPAASVQRPTS